MDLEEYLEIHTGHEVNVYVFDDHTTTRNDTLKAQAIRELPKEISEWSGIKDAIRNELGPRLSHKFPRWTGIYVDDIKAIRTISDKSGTVQLCSRAFEDPATTILRDIWGLSGGFANYRTAVNINIGNPDKVFFKLGDPKAGNEEDAKPRARFVAEIKTPWTTPLTSTLRIHYNTGTWLREAKAENIVEAITQLYGYMTFNNLRYGILSNYESTFLFRRTVERGSLEVSPMFRSSDKGLDSPLAAYVYLCILTLKGSFYHCPTDNTELSLGYRVLDPDLGPYHCSRDSEIDWERCQMKMDKLLSRRVASVLSGCIIDRQTKNIVLDKVIFKVYDIAAENSRRRATKEIENYNYLMRRAKMTDNLKNHIPTLYLATTVWGFLLVLILEDCGKALRSHIPRQFQRGADEAVQALHNIGMLHGDIKPDNFAVKDGRVKIIDFELSEIKGGQCGANVHISDEKKEEENETLRSCFIDP